MIPRIIGSKNSEKKLWCHFGKYFPEAGNKMGCFLTIWKNTFFFIYFGRCDPHSKKWQNMVFVMVFQKCLLLTKNILKFGWFWRSIQLFFVLFSDSFVFSYFLRLSLFCFLSLMSFTRSLNCFTSNWAAAARFSKFNLSSSRNDSLNKVYSRTNSNKF